MAVTGVVIAFADGPGGRFRVTETFNDAFGPVYVEEYLTADVDYEAVANRVANARIAFVDERIACTEAQDALRVDAAPTLRHQTGAQFLQRVRAFYKDAAKSRAAEIAAWIVNRLDAGHVTATQMQNVFGLTAGQWTTLETKLRNLKTAHDAVVAATGE